MSLLLRCILRLNPRPARDARRIAGSARECRIYRALTLERIGRAGSSFFARWRLASLAPAILLGAFAGVSACWLDPYTDSAPEWSLGAVVLDAVGGSAAPSLPVTAGVALHLDAAVGGAADGTPLNAWNDSGPLSYHLSAPVAMPTYQSNSIGGRPGIRFPAAPSTAHYIQSAVASMGQSLTLAVIFRRNVVGAYGHLFSLGAACPGGSDDAYNVYIPADGRVNLDRRLVSLVLAAATPMNDLDPHVVILRSDASSPQTSLYLDGALDAQSVAGYFFNTDPVLIVGNNCTFASPLNGDIAELVLYSRALAVAEIDALHCYAASKYALSLSGACAD